MGKGVSGSIADGTSTVAPSLRRPVRQSAGPVTQHHCVRRFVAQEGESFECVFDHVLGDEARRSGAGSAAGLRGVGASCRRRGLKIVGMPGRLSCRLPLPRLPLRAQAVRHSRRWQSSRSSRKGMKPLVDLVYPPRCPLCGCAIADQDGLCGDCWSLLEFPSQSGAGCDQHGAVPVSCSDFVQ